MEFGTTKRLAQSAAAAVQFGVDQEEALAKVEKLTQRLAKMEEVRCVLLCAKGEFWLGLGV